VANHFGIVAEIPASLAALGVGIEGLSTDVRETPMALGTLFAASAPRARPGTSTEGLRSMLEQLAAETGRDQLVGWQGSFHETG
jgi:hypothetical protein